MPYQLVDTSRATQYSGPTRLLHRKFSWEEGYEQEQPGRKEIVQPTEPLNVINKYPERPPFQRRTSDEEHRIRRKPIPRDSVIARRLNFLTAQDAGSDRSRGSISSVESNDSSPPVSISSRSSSASPPPPATRTLPLTPPQAPPIPPPRRPRPSHHVQFATYDMERPEPFPTQSYATPKPKPKSGLSIQTEPRHSGIAAAPVKPVFEGVPPRVMNKTRDIPPPIPVRAARPSVATAQAPLPSRATVASGSPTTPSSQYTAMLDFGKAFNMPKPAGNIAPKHPLPQAKASAITFSMPFRSATESNSPTRYRRTSFVGPKEDGEVSPVGLVGSSIQLCTKASPDPNYRGGYESDENSPSRGRATKPAYVTPKPSDSPKSRPTLPRISTDLSPIKALNIQPVHVPERLPSPKANVRFADEGLTSADVQSNDLTNILNMYLDEVINDAKSRGVMSSGLEEYLKSPTIMGEWKKDFEIVREDRPVGNGNVVRTVSIVRRALHCD